MLIVFYGTDMGAVRQAAFIELDKIRDGSPEVVINRVESTEYVSGMLASVSKTASLFGGTQAYLLDTPEEKDEYKEELLNSAKILSESEHYFIVITGTLLVAEKKLLATAQKINEFKSTVSSRFNTFSMADALARRDKRSLWLLLQEARAQGLVTEEIIGMLWWQIKILRLAILTKTASEAGVKDFPYNKAKKAIANFKSGEIKEMGRTLLVLYHDGHAGKRDMDLALEEWVLKG